jgi:hypothetical protein
MRQIFMLAAVTLLVSSSDAWAQRDRLLVEPSPPAEWALTGSLTPTWDMNPLGISVLANAEKEDITGPDGKSTLSGSDWSIGFARGRAVSWDWGVSYVRTRITKDSVIDRTFTFDGQGPGGVPTVHRSGERVTFREVWLNGAEAHMYVPFVTFADRVQIGMMLAGGGGKFSGTVRSEMYEFDGLVQRVEDVEGDVSVADQLYWEQPWTLTGRIEPGIAIIFSPRFKVRAGAGFHYPGTTYFSLGATYYFPHAAP